MPFPRHPLLLALALGALTAALAAVSVPERAEAARATLDGQARSGPLPRAGYEVTLYRSRSRAGRAIELGSARADRRGRFRLRYRLPRDRNAVLYVIARGHRQAAVLAAVLGTKPIPGWIVINERTTVATGYAEGQFLRGRTIGGAQPGPQNAALMARNLARLRNGKLARVIKTPPNGPKTSARRTFNTLSNMVARCIRSRQACRTFLRLATPRGGPRPPNTLQVLANIAADPSHNARALFRYSRAGRRVYRLARTSAPSAWILALRFDGDGRSLDGPGNFAIDAEGSVWVANNYEYTPTRSDAACTGDQLIRFTPAGRYHPGSPYEGGGVSGAGYGIGIDPKSRVWVGNFGFAAPPPYCPDPPADSVSRFSPRGVPQSGPSGFVVGGIDWPQATVSDRKGNIWVANCGFTDTPGGPMSSVTRIAGGNPAAAQNISGIGITRGFGLALNHKGQAFVAGNGSNTVAVLNNDGTPAPGSPITGGGLNRPLGVISDSRGNIWVANSAFLNSPCPPPAQPGTSVGGTLTRIGRDGGLAPRNPVKGGGLTIPFGITVDGDDQVWVGNFQGRRISRFCGTRTGTCPAGRRRTGRAISPRAGYGFDGLARVTGVAVDPSGNVWIANNWKRIPGVQTPMGFRFLNPGGYQVVVYVGAAAPVKTPIIGTPRPLRR